MTQNLKKFLTGVKNKEFATRNGLQMHTMLQRVVIDNSVEIGDQEVIEVIKQRPNLKPFFVQSARTEVPIAGVINGVFISRRIDRLLINNDTKTIDFIDYKTDINKEEFVEKYKKQLKEYAMLLQSAYPYFKINGYILWLHNWTLDKIIKQ